MQELADLKENSRQITVRWQNEKQAIADLRQIKEQIEQTRTEIDRAERQSDLEKAARLQYGSLPELENKLAQAEKRLKTMQAEGVLLKEEVDAEEIASIVARWTGIPISKLLEGETQKLIHMEAGLHQRVVGQDDAVQVVANAVRRTRAGLQDPEPSNWFLHFSWANRCW